MTRGGSSVFGEVVGIPCPTHREVGGEMVIGYPWLRAVSDVRCGWCDRPLAACYCLDRDVPPARPLPPLAVPARCRDCRCVLEFCDCRKRKNDARYRQTYRQKRRKLGLCAAGCGTASTSYICGSCGARNAELHRARRRRYVEMGLCQQCGKRPYEPGRVQCRPCLDRLADAARSRRWRAKRAAG